MTSVFCFLLWCPSVGPCPASPTFISFLEDTEIMRLQKCAMLYLKNRASYFQPSLLRGLSGCQRLWAGRYITKALFEEVPSLKVLDNLLR